MKITKRYFDAHPDAVSTLKDIPALTSRIIFDEARKGDQTALEMVGQVGYLLGKALAGIACVVNPEVFVIGGGMSKAGDILIDSIRNEYRRFAFHASRETEFKLAELGNRAGIYGGVRMILE